MSLDFQALEIADWIVWIKKLCRRRNEVGHDSVQYQADPVLELRKHQPPHPIQISIQFLGKV